MKRKLIALPATLATFGLALCGMVTQSQAALIKGGLSFNTFGEVFTDGTNPVTSLLTATQVDFSPVVPNGRINAVSVLSTFQAEGVQGGALGTLMNFYGPLVFSPGLIVPIPLFTFQDGNGDTFSFDLTSVNIVAPSSPTLLNLKGFGMMTHPDYEPTEFTFSANGTTDGQGTYSFGGSIAARTPDGGTSVALLGLSLIGIGGVRRFMAKKP